MTHVSGVGSWPGESSREAVVTVRDLLADVDGHGLPYLPELPSRGPGSDLIGRSAALLADLSVDLQPSGWRFTDRPGRDSARARAFLRQDLDELAEAYDGYAGPLKIQVAGPWTLGASIELNRGERSVTDEGARRDLVASLTEGVRQHVADVQRLVPGAVITVQLDEPSVLSVLRGELPTASGYGRVRAVDRVEVARGIQEVRDAHDGDVVLHSCHPDAPVELLAATGVTALALDLTESSAQRWEAVAAAVEAGTRLWAGVVPTSAVTSSADAVRTAVAHVVEGFGRVGLPLASLADVTVTPTCGLPSLTPRGAVDVQRVAVAVAGELTEKEHD
ncbi:MULTISPECIES: methionine synthase [unclassified Knoellia]|uniref:methionine synthase n=1 Tax=Knoellia altitudinis TaxID=3404795 RepID=UPI0036205A99